MNVLTAYPKLVILGISVAITFGIGIVSGVLDAQQVHALVRCPYC